MIAADRRPDLGPPPEGLLRAGAGAIAGAAPILRREAIGLLRSRKCYGITLLTVLAAGLAPIASWPAEGDPMPYEAAIATFDQYRQAIIAAICLFVPIVAGAAVTAEREVGTWDLLHAAFARPASIAIGKLVAATLYFEVLLVLTFPVVLRLYLLGGFEIDEFLLFFWRSSAMVVLLGMIGLWASLRSRSTARALFVAYAGGVPLVLIIDANSIERSPVGAAILGAAGLFLLVRAAGRSEPTSPRTGLDELRFTKTGYRRLARPRGLLADDLLFRIWTGIPDHWNPVFVASVRSDAAGGRTVRRFIFWAQGFFALGSAFGIAAGIGSRPPDRTMAMLPLFALAPILLVIPGLAALTLLEERGAGRLDLLRGTSLDAPDVLKGKVLAALFAGSSLFAWNAAACCLLCLFVLTGDCAAAVPGGRGRLLTQLLAFSLLVIPAAEIIVAFFAASAGAFAAAFLRRTIPALVLAYGIVGGLAAILYPFVTAEGAVLLTVAIAGIPGIALYKAAAVLHARGD